MYSCGPYEIPEVEFCRADRIIDGDGLLDVPGVGFGRVIDYRRGALVTLIVLPILSAIAEGTPLAVTCAPGEFRMIVARPSPDEDSLDDALDEILAEAEWVDPVPEYEDLIRDWPDCPDI